MGCGCNKKSVSLAKKFVMAKKIYKIADRFLDRESFEFYGTRYVTNAIKDNQAVLGALHRNGLTDVVEEVTIEKPKKTKKTYADKEEKED